MIYLDHNATSIPLGSVREAIMAWLDRPCNPSSAHSQGQASRRVLTQLRQKIASRFDTPVDSYHTIFTSSASEANQQILTGLRHSHVPFVSAIEHHSLLAPARLDPEHRILPVTLDGVVDLAALESALQEPIPSGRRPLVAVMAANNETGIEQPLASVIDLVHHYGGHCYSDATQYVGRRPFSLTQWPLDALGWTAHKTGGPPGVGVLMTRPSLGLTSIIAGGGQQYGLRGGTEAVALLAGLDAWLDAWPTLLDHAATHTAWRDGCVALMQELTPTLRLIGAGAPRLPGTVAWVWPGKRSEAMVIALDRAGIMVSGGSACSSGRLAPSHVLLAMGIDTPQSLLRISFGPSTQASDLSAFYQGWRAAFGLDAVAHDVATKGIFAL